MEAVQLIEFTGLNSNRYGVKGNRNGEGDCKTASSRLALVLIPPVLNKELNGWPFKGQVAGSPPSDLTAGTAF